MRDAGHRKKQKFFFFFFFFTLIYIFIGPFSAKTREGKGSNLPSGGLHVLVMFVLTLSHFYYTCNKQKFNHPPNTSHAIVYETI